MRTSGIGARLKEIRGHATQAEFAERLDVVLRTYARYEREETPIDSEFLAVLREKCDVSADWLLFGNGERQASHVNELREQAAAYGAPTIDAELLGRILQLVLQMVQDGELELPGERLARLVLAIYEIYAETGKKPDRNVVLRLVK